MTDATRNQLAGSGQCYERWNNKIYPTVRSSLLSFPENSVTPLTIRLLIEFTIFRSILGTVKFVFSSSFISLVLEQRATHVYNFLSQNMQHFLSFKYIQV